MTQPPRKTGDRRGEPERDAWLTEALRHAPDAQSMPSPALSDAILRKARAATSVAAATEIESSPVPQNVCAPSIAAARATSVPSFASRWAAVWSWLAKPPVAAAFASVMLATLVGLMWWDQPLDQTLARRPQAEPAPAASPPATPSVAPAASDSSVTSAATSRTAEKRSADEGERGAPPETEPVPTASPARPPPPAPVAKSERAAKDGKSVELRKSVVPSSPSPSAEKAAATEGSLSRQQSESSADRAEPRAFQDARGGAVDRADIAAQKSRASDVDKAQASGQPAARGASSDPVGNLSSAKPSVPEVGRFSSAAPPIAAAQTPQSARVRTQVVNPLSDLLASISQEPQRWTWRRSGGLQPMSSSLQTWLIQLDANTNSRWTALQSSTPSATGAVSRSDAAATSSDLHLYRGDELQATLRIVDDQVRITSPDAEARASIASLPQTTITALRRTLDLAAP